MSFNWNCPYCGRDQTVIDKRMHEITNAINVGGVVEGDVSACAFAIGCSNDDCNKLTVVFSIRPHTYREHNRIVAYNEPALYVRRALPESSAKPQPDCVPKPLVDDYLEACLIRHDSPKASATLSRRCMQGMIRDFCGIAKSTLAKEIEALKEAVDSGNAPAGVTTETVEAIDQVRSIGNIGAHMEKEIDLIIPVDPDEAQVLIELIEMLFEEWYVARDTRKKRLATIRKISAEKKQLIAGGRAEMKALAAPDAEVGSVEPGDELAAK